MSQKHHADCPGNILHVIIEVDEFEEVCVIGCQHILALNVYQVSVHTIQLDRLNLSFSAHNLDVGI